MYDQPLRLKNIFVLHTDQDGTSFYYETGNQRYTGYVTSSIENEKLEVIVLSGNPKKGLCLVVPKDGIFADRCNGLLVNSEHLS